MTAPRADVLQDRWPLGMSRAEASAYIGVSATLFDAMVDDGRMPLPKLINTKKVWNRYELDSAHAALPTPEAGAGAADDIWSKVSA